jgi:hypothetical protein
LTEQEQPPGKQLSGGCFFFMGYDGKEISGNITPDRYFSTLTGKQRGAGERGQACIIALLLRITYYRNRHET